MNDHHRMDGPKATAAWLVQSNGIADFRAHTKVFTGELSLYQGISESDWLLILDQSNLATHIGRIYRIRSDLDHSYLYLDKELALDPPAPLTGTNLSPPSTGPITRVPWTDFAEALPKLCGKTVADIPLIQDHAYVRELLQHALMDDLLGPAGGPEEQIVDMGVRDRYLVGKLSPRDAPDGGIEGLSGPMATEEVEEPAAIEAHTSRHEPGAEFDSTRGRVDAEAEAGDEIDASSNQSLVPSSFGITFCVGGDVQAIEVEARWGGYQRLYDHDISKKRISKKTGKEEQIPVKVWQRSPRGGRFRLRLREGLVTPLAPDDEVPGVRVQGSIRARNKNGDRLVTLFLVNAQADPETNKDSAWLFQPELVVRAPQDGAGNEQAAAPFRRRPAMDDKGEPERLALEMLYRKQVEFAVGHGVAVHSEPSPENREWATEIRSVVMPRQEVPVTETPGLSPEDRTAMRRMVRDGLLDMELLAGLARSELISTLSILVGDYQAWIGEQRGRIGVAVVGHDRQAGAALERCEAILSRLREGLSVLADDDRALQAFRLANQAMATQRIHGLYALACRRAGADDAKPRLSDFEQPKNRSWRPFQLAFVLLSLPSLADPRHPDRRTSELTEAQAHADLIWFPTGGGKTEAYLGVAAFTMFIRRLHGEVGGYDGSCGLGVIMRYTLRLLTLQQFQRATTLICAMELIRRGLDAEGDDSLGSEPFTIGLWVGNKVTPGTTEDSHAIIRKSRDQDKWKQGGASPAQLTNCPWCGSEIEPGRDIEVDKARLRTSIYCGDKLSRCEFSRGRSSGAAHPGIPALVVDEEIYHRPPSMMIATVDKFAMMAWRGQTRTLFGMVRSECPRHGLLWPGSDCNGRHTASKGLPATQPVRVGPIRPPDLIIQDEFHLISGPLGTMVGLYETAVDALCGWTLEGARVQPKVIASTATVRKADEQMCNVFLRRVAVFPPHGLDIEDNFFAVQRPITERPGRRYLGICSPGSSRPAMLIRVYTALLTAAQALFDRFGKVADPYMTTVGYFNSLRELGGMKRLSEDDVQTRSYRVQMSLVGRPGLAQRSVRIVGELTSRISSGEIPKYLDQLEVEFKAAFDPAKAKFVTAWDKGESRAIDVVLATNMLSVGVDVNRLGAMVVNGQPKGTAEYIQATSRVGRQFPGLVCTVLTWARPRDLSHYETFEHYHATFYKHVEAQSVTPFSPRAMDRGLTGTMLSILRLEQEAFNPNVGAGAMAGTTLPEVVGVTGLVADRAWRLKGTAMKDLAEREMKERIDEWHREASRAGRTLAYEKRGSGKETMVALLEVPGLKTWGNFTVPMSMREVEPGVALIMDAQRLDDGPKWRVRPPEDNSNKADGSGDRAGTAKQGRKRAPKKKTSSGYYLAELAADIAADRTLDVDLPDERGVHRIRFLADGEAKPAKGTWVVVIHDAVGQLDTVPGTAFGKLHWSSLQDASTGEPQVNVMVKRPGAGTSFRMSAADWERFTAIGLLVDTPC